MKRLIAFVVAAVLAVTSLAAGDPLAGWKQAVAKADTGKEPLVAVLIGDSNTEIYGYAGAVRNLLQGCYGARGAGYYTFGKRMEEIPGAPKIERQGNWTCCDFATDPKDPTPPKPWMAMDGLWITTDDAAASVAVKTGYAAVTRVHFQKGPGLGKFKVVLDGQENAAKEVDCAAGTNAYGTVEFSATAFLIKVVSGKVTLFGMDAERTTMTGGAVVHQLGNGWGMAHQFAAIEQDAYDAFFRLARPSLITILLGTNDMNNGWDAKGYLEQMRILLGKIRKAAPDATVLVMSCPSCTFDRKSLSGDFSKAAQTAAGEFGCAFWNLNDWVGDKWMYWDHEGLMEYTLHYTPMSGTMVALQMMKELGFDVYDPQHAPAMRNPASLLKEGVKPAERAK